MSKAVDAWLDAFDDVELRAAAYFGLLTELLDGNVDKKAAERVMPILRYAVQRDTEVIAFMAGSTDYNVEGPGGHSIYELFSNPELMRDEIHRNWNKDPEVTNLEHRGLAGEALHQVMGLTALPGQAGGTGLGGPGTFAFHELFTDRSDVVRLAEPYAQYELEFIDQYRIGEMLLEVAVALVGGGVALKTGAKAVRAGSGARAAGRAMTPERLATRWDLASMNRKDLLRTIQGVFSPKGTQRQLITGTSNMEQYIGPARRAVTGFLGRHYGKITAASLSVSTATGLTMAVITAVDPEAVARAQLQQLIEEDLVDPQSLYLASSVLGKDDELVQEGMAQLRVGNPDFSAEIFFENLMTLDEIKAQSPFYQEMPSWAGGPAKEGEERPEWAGGEPKEVVRPEWAGGPSPEEIAAAEAEERAPEPVAGPAATIPIQRTVSMQGVTPSTTVRQSSLSELPPESALARAVALNYLSPETAERLHQLSETDSSLRQMIFDEGEETPIMLIEQARLLEEAETVLSVAGREVGQAVPGKPSIHDLAQFLAETDKMGMVGLPGFMLEGREQYFEGDHLHIARNMDDATFDKVEQQLYDLGYIDPTNHSFGTRDAGFVNAMGQVVFTADMRGRNWQSVIPQILDDQRTYDALHPDLEDQFYAPQRVQPDYVGLVDDARRAIRARLGRDATDAELNMFARQMQREHQGEYDVFLANEMAVFEYEQAQKRYEDQLEDGRRPTADVLADSPVFNIEGIPNQAVGTDPLVKPTGGSIQEYDKDARVNEWFQGKYQSEMDENRRSEALAINARNFTSGLQSMADRMARG